MRELHVLSLGAGVQSTTLYLMFLRGDITPQIDAAVFADTQEEPSAVYRHLAWLQSLDGPPILTCTAGKLGDDLTAGRNSTGQRFASIPAFVTDDGGRNVAMVRRQCSKEYKTEIINQTIRRQILGLQPRQRIPKDVLLTKYFGISFDEGGRAKRITENLRKDGHKIPPRFPLIERFMTRANCIDWLFRYGVPHETPRSACTFCPYHTDHEWDRIKREDPEGWARAVAIDHALRGGKAIAKRGLTGDLYLHRSCRPLDLVQLNTKLDPRKAQLSINFSVECEGMCGV
jgi:hypothetical protein